MTVLIREFSPGWSKKLQGKTESGSCPHPPTLTTPRCQPLGSEAERKRLSRIVSGELETMRNSKNQTENHFLLS